MNSKKKSSQAKWRQIAIIFRFLSFLQITQVRTIKTLKSFTSDFNKMTNSSENSPLNNKTNKKIKNSERNADKFNHALDEIIQTDNLCRCCEEGGAEIISKLSILLEKYPKMYLLDSKDPEHLLNKKNAYGVSPLYLACKNGNLNVVKYFLEECNANLFLKSKISLIGKEESNLEVSSRWNHVEIVKYLMKFDDWDKECIASALKQTTNTEIIRLLRMKTNGINNIIPKKRTFFFCY